MLRSRTAALLLATAFLWRPQASTAQVGSIDPYGSVAVPAPLEAEIQGASQAKLEAAASEVIERILERYQHTRGIERFNLPLQKSAHAYLLGAVDLPQELEELPPEVRSELQQAADEVRPHRADVFSFVPGRLDSKDGETSSLGFVWTRQWGEIKTKEGYIPKRLIQFTGGYGLTHRDANDVNLPNVDLDSRLVEGRYSLLLDRPFSLAFVVDVLEVAISDGGIDLDVLDRTRGRVAAIYRLRGKRGKKGEVNLAANAGYGELKVEGMKAVNDELLSFGLAFRPTDGFQLGVDYRTRSDVEGPVEGPAGWSLRGTHLVGCKKALPDDPPCNPFTRILFGVEHHGRLSLSLVVSFRGPEWVGPPRHTLSRI